MEKKKIWIIIELATDSIFPKTVRELAEHDDIIQTNVYPTREDAMDAFTKNNAEFILSCTIDSIETDLLPEQSRIRPLILK